jgi:hypothetical protein
MHREIFSALTLKNCYLLLNFRSNRGLDFRLRGVQEIWVPFRTQLPSRRHRGARYATTMDANN